MSIFSVISDPCSLFCFCCQKYDADADTPNRIRLVTPIISNFFMASLPLERRDCRTVPLRELPASAASLAHPDCFAAVGPLLFGSFAIRARGAHATPRPPGMPVYAHG